MIFVDEAKVFVKAGDGGKGCVSFLRDKYLRYPRPNGGSGAKGGDVIFIADKRYQTLLDYKFKRHHKAKSGGHGGSQSKKGRGGEDCCLKVPVGTIVKDQETGLLIKDLVEDQQSVIVARGGEGGKGNDHNRTPTPPRPGEERNIDLELKLIADVGIIGFPNAGKSTFISQISKVRSKIANYPFTTKKPILGFVDGEEQGFVIADLPGIIEGAHKGKGLGDRFLRHAERTRILVQMVDISGSENRDPLHDFETLRQEITAYGDILVSKPIILVANKMDLPQAQENLQRLKERTDEDIISISCLNNEGLEMVVNKIREYL